MRKLKGFLFAASFMLMTLTSIIAPVFSGPPYYHEEGNVNYSGSYFESVYVEKGVGIDDYIIIIDDILMGRSYGSTSDGPWRVGSCLYNPDADVAFPYGEIDVRDVFLAAMHWGLTIIILLLRQNLREFLWFL